MHLHKALCGGIHQAFEATFRALESKMRAQTIDPCVTDGETEAVLLLAKKSVKASQAQLLPLSSCSERLGAIHRDYRALPRDLWTSSEVCPSPYFASRTSGHWHVRTSQKLNCGAWLGQFLMGAADHRLQPSIKGLYRKTVHIEP